MAPAKLSEAIAVAKGWPPQHLFASNAQWTT
jgi:hypothetical protein